MFKRKNPRTLGRKFREAVWPSMGWRRAARYTKLRMVRLPDTTRKIAAGLAIGASISFSPLVGTHFIQATLLAYIFRANIVAAFVGTYVGNPWTFPFIWWASFELGVYIFGLFGWETAADLPDQITAGILWDFLKTEPMQVFLPLMTGGYLIGLLIWSPAYGIYYYVLWAARQAREKVMQRARKKKAEKLKSQVRT